MRVPIICMDHRLRQFAAAFHACFSKPQRRYFEIVLLALLLCQEAHTLSGLLRQVLARVTLSGLSRFLGKAPWSTAAVAATYARASTRRSLPWSMPPMPGTVLRVPPVPVVPLHPS